MMARNLFFAAAVMALAALSATSAQAALIAYEGFDYTAEADLVGQTGGEGLVSSGWVLGADPGGYDYITAAGLSNPDTTDTGLAVYIYGKTGMSNRYDRAIDVSQAGARGYSDVVGSNSKLGVAGQSVWISHLENADSVGNTSALAMFDNTYMSVYFGTSWGSKNWRLGGNNVETITSDVEVIADQTMFAVSKVEWSADGTTTTYSLWVDPADVSSEAALGTPTATLAASGLRQFQTVTVMSAYGSTFDEVRIGTLLGDVVGVPEPATMTLLGLGSLFVLRRRR